MNQQDKNPWNSIGSVSARDAKAPSKSSAPAPRVDLPPIPVESQDAPRQDLVVAPSFERPPVAPGQTAESASQGAPAAAPSPTPPSESATDAVGPKAPPAPAPVPETFPPAPQMPRPAAKKTGVVPLVLGVASILLCFLPIVSTVMGATAIVLAIRAARRGEYSGMLTAGKVTGIIGTILSIIALIMTVLSITLAARMYDSLASQSPGLDITQGYSSGQRDAWMAVEEKMDALVSQNPQDAAVIADAFSQYLDEDSELAPYMQGCDPRLYATWAVLGLEYEDDGVFISGDQGYAYVSVTLRDGFALIDTWTDLLDQAAAKPGLADTTDEEFARIFTDTYLKALSVSDETYDTTLVLDLQKSDDGSWMVTDESWDESLVYLFGL